MLHPMSPYALLCASKPKQPSCATAEYDLFSLSQADATSSSAEPRGSTQSAAMLDMQASPTLSASNNLPRTHYISDIKNRHAKAIRHTTQHSGSL